MNEDDLWIGDTVKLLMSGRVGTYEGKSKDGRARVKMKYGEKILLTSFSNLEIYEQKNIVKVALPVEDAPLVYYDTTIDLHINRLAPDLEHEAPQLILAKQLSVCRDFVTSMLDQKKLECTIVHGVGTGALRMEVEHLLGSFDEVQVISLVNNGGATLVRFGYYTNLDH